MRRIAFRLFALAAAIHLLLSMPARGQESKWPGTTEGDFVVKDFKFRSGEALPELRLHYTTLGKPVRNAQGRVTNVVLILHGTGGTGHQFLTPIFASELFGPGQLLDATRYFIVLPDGIGHGKSSKPSDGLHAHFPQYDYDDMVAAHHQLLSEGLGVNHLRLILGTSMGCMHSFVWGETFPDFMDALMPLASLPVQIAGRNRMTRRMVIDSIKSDPDWNGGEYKTQPRGVTAAIYTLIMMGSSPRQWQKQAPTRDAADKLFDSMVERDKARIDANDMLYQFDASRDYDPAPLLERIRAPLFAINSADDQVNPPELGIMEREIKRVKRGRYILIPISDKTRGHGTHSLPAIWQQDLARLLNESRTRLQHRTAKTDRKSHISVDIRGQTD